MSLWVCSKWINPTDAHKWEVLDDLDDEWEVRSKTRLNDQHYLPKSDYIPCDPPHPPERWMDVTAECEKSPNRDMQCVIKHGDVPINTQDGYRLRKVKCCDAGGLDCDCPKPGQWAFVVERKESA